MLALPVFILFVSLAACNSKTSDADVKTSVDNAIAANSNLSGAYADVKDGVVTLTGELERAKLQDLMMALNALKPKRIENQLTLK